jgi:hypothetical protein
VSAAGERDDLARWLANFATAHAKREDPRVEVELGTPEPGHDVFHLRLRLGALREPAPPAAPLPLPRDEVERGHGRLDWCQALAARLREAARRLGAAGQGTARSA